MELAVNTSMKTSAYARHSLCRHRLLAILLLASSMLQSCSTDEGQVPVPTSFSSGGGSEPFPETNTPLALNGDAARIPAASSSVPLDDHLDVDAAYLGAFDQNDDWAAGWSQLGDGAAPASLSPTQTLPAVISADMTLTAGGVYRLADGGSRVEGGVLRVEAGAVLVAASAAALQIASTAAIEVVGSREAPVVMTNLNDSGGGEWGGLQIEDGARASQLAYLQLRHAASGLRWQASREDSRAEYVEIRDCTSAGLQLAGGRAALRRLILVGNANGVQQTGDWSGLLQNVWIEQAGGVAVAAADRARGQLANATLLGNGSGTALAYTGSGAGRALNLLVKGFSQAMQVTDVAAFDAALRRGQAAIFQSVIDPVGNTLYSSTVYPDWFTLARDNRREALNFSGRLPDGVEFSGLRFRPDGAGRIDTAVNFIGAFDPAVYDPAVGPTLDSDWTYGWTVGLYDDDGDGSPDADHWQDDLLVADSQCPAGTTSFDATTCVLPARITEDLHLTADKVYAINPDNTIVGRGEDQDSSNDIAVDLIIDPGIKVIAGDGLRLVISRGARMLAEGRRSRPITFTSSRDVPGVDETDGQWGGIMVLGYGPSTQCSTGDCQVLAEGSDGDVIHYFGGSNPDDDSGVYRYLVIKHSGKKLSQEGNEINAITFQGVGSRTIVDYVESYKCIDDGMQFEASSLIPKHVVLVGNNDDAVDWEHGFTGGMQFVQILHNGAKDIPRAFETDTSTADPRAQPTSNPVIANVSAVRTPTSDTQQAIWFRFGTAGLISNSLFDQYGSSCFVVEHEPTQDLLFADADGDGLNDGNPAVYLDIRNTFAECSRYTAEARTKTGVSQETVTQWYFAADKHNQKLPSELDATAHPTLFSPQLLDSVFHLNLPGRE